MYTTRREATAAGDDAHWHTAAALPPMPHRDWERSVIGKVLG